MDLQIVDIEASAAFKQAITFAWHAKFQLVPPDMHSRNCAERAIRTFKDHFLAILAGIDKSCPPYLWDLLLPQAELTLNLLRQSTINPKSSAWEFFNGPFDFIKTPLGPVGCRVLIHAKPTTRRSWDFRAKEGFYIGPALDSYRCFKLVKMDTKSQVKFRTQLNFGMPTAPSQCQRLRVGLSTVSTLSLMRSWTPLPPLPYPSSMRYPISEMCLNRGASWLLHQLGIPESLCPAIQGWSCLTHLFPNISLRHGRTSHLGQHGRLRPRRSQLFVSATPMWSLSLHDGLRLLILPLQQEMRPHLQGWAVYHLQGWPLNRLCLKPPLYHQGYLLLTAPGHVPMLPWPFFLAKLQSMRVMSLHQRVLLRQPPSPWDLLGCVELTP